MPLPHLPCDEDGLPIAGPIEERASRIVAWIATTFFALAAAWEIGGPLLAGHYASSASVGIIAENMWKWHILGPVWDYTAARPGPEAYYCHHPWGIFWTTALLMKVLGRHDFVCRLAPVLLSAVTPPLLYGIGRAIWRPAAGAAAALGFVVLPISLAFAHFNALEVPVMAWTLLGLYGWVRFLQTYRKKYGALAVAGFTLAMHADWPAFVLVAEILALGLVRLYVVRGAFGRAHERRYAALWIALACAAVLTFGLYVWLFVRSGRLGDLIGAYSLRSAGQQAPLSAVLASRRYWLQLTFTPVAIFLGKVAAVIAALRFVVGRREIEAVPLLYLGMAVFQYVVFKQGADVHVFWPHTFAAYFGLALGALTATLVPFLELAWQKRPSLLGLRAAHAPVLTLAIVALPLAVVLRDALPALKYARQTGGRFDEHGRLIDSDGAATAFLRWLDARLPQESSVEMHEGMKPTWAQSWALGGRVVGGHRPVPREPAEAATYLVDTRFMYDELQAGLAERFRVVAVGPFWQVDRSVQAPIEAFSIREREPSWLEWYLVSGTEPARSIVPDPLLTWELRAHFGQPAEPIEKPPETLEDRRILHNMAIARGDAARAAALAAEIEASLRPLHARFDDGTEILGARYEDGVLPVLVLVLRAGGPTPKDAQLTVKSRVIERARFSTTMADPSEREVGLPLPIPPERWKKGFLYADHVPIRKRPGREVFAASFWARRRGAFPKPEGNRKAVQVLALP
jgi:4-amino-4-deoxy-L-arabinose transferase-like glycosyltransferase